MKIFTYPVLLLFCSIFTIFSCKLPVDDVDTSVEAEIAVPLADSKTTVKDMLRGIDSTSILRFDPDGQVVAQFTTFANSNTTLDPFDGIPNNFVPLLDTAFAIPFAPPGGLKIGSADFKKGMTNFVVYNNLPEPLTITFRIPQITKNGVMYKKKFSLCGSVNCFSLILNVGCFVLDGQQ